MEEYRGDCARCAALCCVALAFDAGDRFAYDKPAGEPCRNLSGHDCTIHERLEDEGFSGCVRYDCLGAGQLVVQEVFAGRSWQGAPGLLAPMMTAFRTMRRVRELAQLLDLAGRLPLDAGQEGRRAELRAALSPEGGWTEARLAAFEAGALPRAIPDFLAGLRAEAEGLRGR